MGNTDITCTDNCSSSMNVFSLNIQGVSGKIHLLDSFISEVNQNIVAICLSEHWLKQEEIVNLRVSDFVTASFFCRSQRKRGGVAVMVKKAVQVVPLVIDSLSIECDAELAGVLLPDVNLIIIATYRSPTGNFENFISTITNALDSINFKSKKIVVVGDFNVHFNKDDQNAKRLCDVFAEYGLFSNFSEPTRCGNCLDNVFSNVRDNLANAPVDFLFSDHLGILTSLPLVETTSPTTSLTVQPTTSKGLFALYNLVRTQKFDFMLNSNKNIEERVLEFINILSNCKSAYLKRI